MHADRDSRPPEQIGKARTKLWLETSVLTFVIQEFINTPIKLLAKTLVLHCIKDTINRLKGDKGVRATHATAFSDLSRFSPRSLAIVT